MFNGMMPGLSLADIAAVTNGNRNNGWGADGGGWWAWIILLALFGFGDGGFGGNGMWGNRGNCCNANAVGAAVGAEVQRGFDTSAIITKLDGINNGICSLGYDQLAQMNGINNTIMQTGFGLQQSINNQTVAQMQDTNALSRQLGDCCCENRAAIAQVRYDMATDTCSVVNAIKDASQAQIQNCNANYRQLHDEMVQMQMDAKNETIAALRQQLNDCSRDSALQGTASYIINSINPQTRPAYLTCNPNTGMVFPCGTNWNNGNCNGCGGCNNGCC